MPPFVGADRSFGCGPYLDDTSREFVVLSRGLDEFDVIFDDFNLYVFRIVLDFQMVRRRRDEPEVKTQGAQVGDVFAVFIFAQRVVVNIERLSMSKSLAVTTKRSPCRVSTSTTSSSAVPASSSMMRSVDV